MYQENEHTLQYFNVAENYAVDITHNILEGVGQFEGRLLFGYLVKHFISKERLLNRVYAFNYGYLEKKNRPTNINLNCVGRGVGLNASQTHRNILGLITNTPLLFGDLVPEDDLHWHLMLLLLNIINIVFSYTITEGMTVYLKHLIIEHHRHQLDSKTLFHGPLSEVHSKNWTTDSYMDYEIRSQTHIFPRLCEELKKCDSITCEETPVCSSLSLGMLDFKSS